MAGFLRIIAGRIEIIGVDPGSRWIPDIHCPARLQKGLHAKILPRRNERQGKRQRRRDSVPTAPAAESLAPGGSFRTWMEPDSIEGDQKILYLLLLAVRVVARAGP